MTNLGENRDEWEFVGWRFQKQCLTWLRIKEMDRIMELKYRWDDDSLERAVLELCSTYPMMTKAMLRLMVQTAMANTSPADGYGELILCSRRLASGPDRAFCNFWLRQS